MSRVAFDRAATIILAAILVVAAFLRFYKLDFDLPEVQYVDGAKFAGEAARMARTGDLHPALFQYPGLYVNLLVGLYRALGITSEYGYQLAATAVSALFGLATVFVTACAARNLTGTLAMLIATALAAASPALVTASRAPSPDVLCMFFMTVVFAVVTMQPARMRTWVGLGAAAGLAVSAKWTGAFVLPVMATTIAVTAWRRRSWALVLRQAPATALAALAAFLATTPFFLPMGDLYLGDLRFEAHLQRAGQIGRVQLNALDYLISSTPTWETPWLGTSLLSDLGLPVLLCSLAGIVLAMSGRFGFAGLSYAAIVVSFVVAVSGAGWIKALRFLLPVYPLICVLAGAFVESALPTSLRQRPLVSVVAVVALVAAPLSSSLSYVMALRQPSTNAVAREWMRQHVVAGSVVFLGPFFTEDFAPLAYPFIRFEGVGALQYNLPEELGRSPEREPVYNGALVDDMKGAGVEYVVLNSYFDDAFTRVAENERFFPQAVANYEAFQRRLRDEATSVFAIRGWQEGRVGPDISIWRFVPSSASQ